MTGFYLKCNPDPKWVKVNISFNPVGIYLFIVNNENAKNVNNKDTRMTVFIVNFEQISHILLMLLFADFEQRISGSLMT